MRIVKSLVRVNKPKMLSGLNQNGKVAGTCVISSHVADNTPPGHRRNLTLSVIRVKQGNPIGFFNRRRLIVRLADKPVGTGCRKKRKPFCNGMDMSLNVTHCESKQTFDWSFIARKFGEPI